MNIHHFFGHYRYNLACFRSRNDFEKLARKLSLIERIEKLEDLEILKVVQLARVAQSN